ncbi:MAG: KH domain-containing protein [Myxococcota bacterium]|jgi:predicted RNA-binding protein YlqC (UPF0109 family)|nr:RNA-binding protein [Spirochaeta sp.]RPG04138.1 MAG: KH domain-containing protein [Proteobacteria bacterium TMED72]
MSEAIDRGTELMEFVAKALVSNPDDVKVEVSDDGRTLELNTADDDRGRVIGRQGRVAKAMRALLSLTPGCSGLRLDIVD